MKKWEYKAIESDHNSEYTQKSFNRLADEGFRFVSHFAKKALFEKEHVVAEPVDERVKEVEDITEMLAEVAYQYIQWTTGNPAKLNPPFVEFHDALDKWNEYQQKHLSGG